jgi:hypothetical protein
MNPTLQLMVSKPTHLRSPLVLCSLKSHFCPLPIAFQYLLILLHCLNTPGSPEHPARKRVRLVEPPHTPIKTQAVPPETQCTIVFFSL